MDYNGMNNYRNQMQESLIDAIKILYDGAITNEKIPKTLECIVSDDSKREQGIYKVKYMHNEFEVSCPLSEIYNRGDAVIVLVPDGDFSKTKIITGSADASGKSSSTDVEANPAAPATQELNKVRIGDIVYDIPEGGGTENAVKDVVVNGISVVTNQIARLSAVSQQELINALSTKVNVTDFETLENEVDNLSDMVDEKASQQDLDDLSSVVDEKADASDVEAELAEKVDLSTYNTDMSLKADKTALDFKQDQLEFNTLEAATETLTRLKADGKVYDLGGGTEVEANPSESATDDLETIKIGDTVYDIPGSGGSSTNYGKFTCDLLFVNDPLPSPTSGTNNVERTYTLNKSIDDYDAVVCINYGYWGYDNHNQPRTTIILKTEYYTTNSSSENGILSNTHTLSYRRDLFIRFTDNMHVKTLSVRNEDNNEPILYKVYGLKFENKLINRSDIYSEEERMIGRWTDGKLLYQKVIHKNGLPVNSDEAVCNEPSNIDTMISIEDHFHFPSNVDVGNNYYASDSDQYRIYRLQGKIYVACYNTSRSASEMAASSVDIVIQYTKTTDHPGSGFLPEDPMFISDPMIYSEEEQVVGSWMDGRPLYQKTLYVNELANNSTKTIAHNISNIDIANMGEAKGVIKHTSGYAISIPKVSDNSTNFQIFFEITDTNVIIYSRNLDGRNFSGYITIQYTKTTDSILSGPKKGKIVQRSDIYSEEERLVGRWTDGKPLYQKTFTINTAVTISNSWTDTDITKPSDCEVIVQAEVWRFEHKGPIFVSATVNSSNYVRLQSSINYSLLAGSKVTLQYTKTTDLPFSKQLIEDPQFVMMSDIYSEDEQVVGRWTDGKPLYQKTIIYDTPFNIANGSWYTSTETYSNMNLINAVIVNSSFANYTGSIVVIENDHLVIGNQTHNQPMNNIKYITLQYTKTTDTPGTGPTPGNIIYLPALYSDEEREVGVWTDGKPLYQKTIPFTLPSSTNSEVRISLPWASDVEMMLLEDGYFINSWQGNDQYVPIESIANTRPGFSWLCPEKQSGGWVLITYLSEPGWLSRSGFATVRYTKTTDQPGSGTWTPEGQLAHHYSTSEKIIGTWIDGKTRYERTYVLRENGVDKYTVGGYANREYQIGLTDTECTMITKMFAKRADGNWDDSRNISTENVLTFNRVDGSIYFQNSHNASDVIVVVEYNKSS